MNVKKAGLVSAGVLTALVAASPLAWAVGPSQEADPNCSFDNRRADQPRTVPDHDGQPGQRGPPDPARGNNIGAFGKCSTFNQHNDEGNFVGNTLNGKELPPPPGLPSVLPSELPGVLTDGVPPLPALPPLPAP